MAHPLLMLALQLDKRARAKRTARTAMSDPHLARDMGLPYRPNPTPRVDKW